MTFILTASIPLKRGFNSALSCIPEADKGDIEKAAASNKKQVREHSRNPMLNSFWGSMDPPEDHLAALTQPREDGFFLVSKAVVSETVEDAR